MAIDTIGTNAIANDAVTAAKIPAGAVDADITAIPDGSVSTAKLADNAVTGAKLFSENLGRRNLLINGSMRVHQRGTTGQPVGGYGYGCDRWRGYNSGTARYDVVREDVTDLATFHSCYKLTVTTAQSSYGSDISVGCEQSIEGTNAARLSFGTSNAQTITVSFYVKSSVTGDFACAIFNGNPIDRSIVQNWTVNSANTWERKTLTFAGDTSGTWRTDSLAGMYIALASIGGSSGTARASAANTWEAGYKNHLANSTNIFATNSATMRFTGIQIEIGDAATPFEHFSFGEDLRLCERYYQEYECCAQEWIYNEGNAATHKWWQSFISTPMRGTPTTSLSSGFLGGAAIGSTVSSLSREGISKNRISWRVTLAGTAGNGNNVYHTDSFNGDKVLMDAEI